ncbi:hypothetical protein MKK65_14970 [Methylobacterium sp. J-001]|jgi:Flp pilus assembly pilin Flp|uniref:Flp family type IVb pilin n=1 Tax=unclassified Methylobacterium TaxID=2615210 RepID=UPI0009E6F987|nr:MULTISPECIES: hypothetical protein [unclassified Methylobacterium]MCJ2117849.1 hypothetical protein [Methylobacterium sp. J-001]
MAEPSCDRPGTRLGRSRFYARARAWQAPTRAARFARDARGSTAIEYAMIGALIFAVVAGSIRYYGSRMVPIYDQISTTVTQAN